MSNIPLSRQSTGTNSTSLQPNDMNITAPSALRMETSPLSDPRRHRDGEADVGSSASNSPQQWAQHSTNSNQHPRRQRQRTTTFEDEGILRASIATDNANILGHGDLTDNVITNQSANPKNSHRSGSRNADNNDTNTTTTFAPEDDGTATTTDVNFTLTDRRTGTSAGLVEDFDTSEDPDATGNESTTTGSATADEDEDIVTATSVATTSVSTVKAAYPRHSGTPQKRRLTSPPTPNPKHVDPHHFIHQGHNNQAAFSSLGANAPEESVPLHFGDESSSEESLSTFASSSDDGNDVKAKVGQKKTGHRRQHSSASRQSTSSKMGTTAEGQTKTKQSLKENEKKSTTKNPTVHSPTQVKKKTSGAKEDDDDDPSSGSSSDSKSTTSSATSSSSASETNDRVSRRKNEAKRKKKGDAYVGSQLERSGTNNYFGAYSDLAVHQLMLSDGPRMRFYHSVLAGTDPSTSSTGGNVPVKGSVVVEVGCGSGVLSVWASKFGKARRVIAFEGSTDMATIATAVAAENEINVRKIKADESHQAKGRKTKLATTDVCGADDAAVFHHKKEQGDASPSDNEAKENVLSIPQMIVVEGISDVVLDKGIDSFITRFLQNDEYQVSEHPSATSNPVKPYLPVSVVFSEWMGFYLLHECMLPSVIRMREFLTEVNVEVQKRNEKWLENASQASSSAAQGTNYGPPTMVPNYATLYVAPVTLRPWYERRFASFWSKISPDPHPRLLAECLGDAGIYTEKQLATSSAQNASSANALSMNVVARLQLDSTLIAVEESGTPLVEILPADSLLHEPQVFSAIDLQRCSQKEALECVGDAKFNFGSSQWSKQKADQSSRQLTNLDGFCVWFDVAQKRVSNKSTDGRDSEHVVASLPTGPLDAPTHWKQSTMLIPSQMRGSIAPLEGEQGGSQDAENPLNIATLVRDGDTMHIKVGIKRTKGRQYTVEYELS